MTPSGNCARSAGETGEPWSALILGGLAGEGARLRADGRLRITASEVRRLRKLLHAGYWIEVETPSRAIWDGIKGDLYRRLQIRPETIRCH